MADRLRRQPSKLERRVRLSQGTFDFTLRGSANGRPPAFEAGYGGSNPSPRTSAAMAVSQWTPDPGQLLLVVTPGSEPGGRWFDSSPRNFLSDGSHPVGSGTCLEDRRRRQAACGSESRGFRSSNTIQRNTVPWPSSEGSAFTRRRSTVQVRPGLLQSTAGPGTPTGRAAWLKPKRLRVRLPPWALVKRQLGSVGNGRPLGLEPGMLWFESNGRPSRLRTGNAVGSSPTWAT